ncbi:MAG: 2Fe-2S iron-sulfur cluster binding domain-containing protein [Gammaproteobacteria bacterium]|nr:2Fe-2S iron-sulfur cluster binding domain-containing protein [Gammaproteobacteria bacterium]
MTTTKFYPLKLADVRPETDSAICVTFDVPADLRDMFHFIQGQFITLRHDIDGEQVRRSYSICSGAHEGVLQVGIKRVPGGKFSNYANDNFKPGDRVEVMPPQGNFFATLNEKHQKHYMCIAAGSGITPMLSIVKTTLEVEPMSCITLIYGNKQTKSVMFKEALGFIKNRYMTRLNWINIMDHEDQGSPLLNGIIDNAKGTALHKAKLINIFHTDEVFICGPEAMMSEVSRGFRGAGFDESRIHYELFTNSAEDSEKAMEKSQLRIATYGEQKTSSVTVKSDSRSIQFELTAVGENILDAGIHHGLDLPFACKAGVCSTCKAKLIKGKVDMDLTHGLEQHEIDANYILTCQAHPISDEVEIDFDLR